VLRDRGGIWVGWSGMTQASERLEELLAEATVQVGYRLRPVMLTEEECEKFYRGFANAIVWPFSRSSIALQV
jgi:trehalose 6-phosphate synthase